MEATSADTVRPRIYTGKPARLRKPVDRRVGPGGARSAAMPLQNILVSEAHQRAFGPQGAPFSRPSARSSAG